MSGESGELFNSVTHLILDEVHEREKITDFLLIAIRDALATQPNLKIILMSATLDSEIFCSYFNNCPVINVPGRMFSVDLIHLGEVLHMTEYKTKGMELHMRTTKGPKALREPRNATVNQEPKPSKHNHSQAHQLISKILLSFIFRSIAGNKV